MTRTLPERWLRTDVIVTVVLVFAGILITYLTFLSGSNFGPQSELYQVMLAQTVMTLPLVLYRRFPATICVLISVLYGVLASTVGVEYTSAQVVLFLPFYAVGAWSANRRQAFWVRLLVVVAMAIWLTASTVIGFSDPEVGERGVTAYLALMGIQYAVNIAYFGAAWIFGERAWESALERLHLEQAHAEIRAQQEVIAELAVQDERLRIARELHDLVAHHVTVMGVQSAAARRLLSSTEPHIDDAVDQLRGVESSSRQAVAELQSLVHTLRDTDEDSEALPGLDQLEELVATAKASGQRVTFEAIGTPAETTPSAELALYRVVQESLSNARKHAGPTAEITVRLRYADHGMEVDVSDNGRGSATTAAGTGTGLTGMTERLNAVGGTLSAGPKSQGGWLVRAWVPTTISVDSAQSERADANRHGQTDQDANV